MSKLIFIVTFFLLSLPAVHAQAQEKYGRTLNLALGVGGYSGYYKYAGRALPVLHLNYELDVAKDFTLAPFISIYTFRDDYYWGNNNTPYRYYAYRETVIPIGVKGTYYFDELLQVGSPWDLYLAGSLGFSIVNSTWEAGYFGEKDPYRGRFAFLDLHLGGEYHINNKLGVFLDLSSGVSTIGLAFHGVH